MHKIILIGQSKEENKDSLIEALERVTYLIKERLYLDSDCVSETTIETVILGAALNLYREDELSLRDKINFVHGYNVVQNIYVKSEDLDSESLLFQLREIREELFEKANGSDILIQVMEDNKTSIGYFKFNHKSIPKNKVKIRQVLESAIPKIKESAHSEKYLRQVIKSLGEDEALSIWNRG